MSCLYPGAVGPEPIVRFTTRLGEAARDADFTTAVPTGGDWTLDDLIWHLTEVQDFWTFVIATRPKRPKNYVMPPRSTGNRQVANLKNAAAGLAATLKPCSPDEPAWSWAAEQTVGFTLRRQTHEALIHCVDGLLALELELPEVSPELAADGIDEIVHVILDQPETAEPGTISLHATDTDDRWTIKIGDGAAVVAGKALDLDLWLWGRGRTWSLSCSGDTDQVATLRARVATCTQ